MKKVRKLSFLGILGVVIAVLFLISISFTQAQVQTQGKPDSPPGQDKKKPEEEVIWAVRIPTSDSGSMFYGIGDGYYENNGSTVTVNVKRNKMTGVWGNRYYDFVYGFNFALINENVGSGDSPAYQVGFQNVSDLYEEICPDEDKPTCQFPPNTSVPPDCMAAFLNGTHPHPDYESFYISIDIFDQDIELMLPGEEYIFGSASEYLAEHDRYEPGDYLFMVARYRNKCYADPPYHDIEIIRNINYWRALDLEYNNAHNIVIERLAEPGIECDGVWRIWVLNYDVSGRNLPGFLKVQERYCTRDKGRATWYYSMEAKGCFDFYIDFIKNPTTN